MSDSSLTPIVDTSYRAMVSDAAGQDYLDEMTAHCIQTVAQFLMARTAVDAAIGSQAHRLAGGTGTVGLPQLAQALRALERASLLLATDTSSLWDGCNDALARARWAIEREKASRIT